MDDLMPPVAPGEKQKAGFFQRVFSKKVKVQPYQAMPDAPPAPEQFRSIPTPIPLQPTAAGPLEKIQASKDTAKSEIDLNKIRQQLGLASVLDQAAPPLVSKENLQANFEQMRPRYSPAKMPAIPQMPVTTPQYKADFTKDSEIPKPIAPLRETAKKDILPDYNTIKAFRPKVESVAAPEVTTPEWAKDVPEPKGIAKAAAPVLKEVPEPRPIVKEPLKKQVLKELEPGAIAKAAKKKEDVDWSGSGLERELTPAKKAVPEKIDFTKDPGSPKVKELAEIPEPEKIKGEVAELDIPEPEAPDFSEPPVIVKRDPGALNIEKKIVFEEKPASDLKIEEPEAIPETSEAPEKAMPEQPVLKYTNELKERLRQQVRKEELPKMMKEVDAERERLKKERSAFEKTRAEKDALLAGVAERERKIAEQKAEVDRTKDTLKQEREKMLAERQEHKELKARIPALKKEYQQLQARISALSEKMVLNQQIEENIAKREKALEEAQERLAEMEHTIRDTGFSNYLETELKGKEISYPVAESKEEVEQKDGNSELFVIADQCRSLIWKNQLDEAKSLYMRARELYHNMLASGESSEQLYMMIRELYDDINLAVLKG